VRRRADGAGAGRAGRSGPGVRDVVVRVVPPPDGGRRPDALPDDALPDDALPDDFAGGLDDGVLADDEADGRGTPDRVAGAGRDRG
jgi:hypothetical protein